MLFIFFFFSPYSNRTLNITNGFESGGGEKQPRRAAPRHSRRIASAEGADHLWENIMHASFHSHGKENFHV